MYWKFEELRELTLVASTSSEISSTTSNRCAVGQRIKYAEQSVKTLSRRSQSQGISGKLEESH